MFSTPVPRLLHHIIPAFAAVLVAGLPCEAEARGGGFAGGGPGPGAAVAWPPSAVAATHAAVLS